MRPNACGATRIGAAALLRRMTSMAHHAMPPTARPVAWRTFSKHFFGMLWPMAAGCAVACVGAFALLRVDLSYVPTGIAFSLAATGLMTAPMAAWMRLRMGHSWRSTAEMSAWMFAPLVVLVPYAMGFVPGLALCPLLCGGMVVAMLGVMLVRRDEYATPHANPA